MSPLPTANLGCYPTPLQPLQRLSDAIGGARIWVKRDDLTGLAMGGSKTRALGGLMGHALALGADTVITCGPKTSNHVRLTAAAANSLGLNAVLVLRRDAADEASQPLQGNLLLNEVLGARVVEADVASLADLAPVMEQVAEELRIGGRKPFVIPGGGFAPRGSAGYLGLVDELIAQTAEQGFHADALVFASGSGCIQSGLLAGLAKREIPTPVLGITINRSVAELHERVCEEVVATLPLLGMASAFDPATVRIIDEFLGPGYAVPSAAGMAAIRTLADLEALLLDPCYTGKAMAAVMDLARHEFGRQDNIVFIHTGGTPGIFAYADALSAPTTQPLS